MEIKPGMKVRLKTLEELASASTGIDFAGALCNPMWVDSIVPDMFAYLGTVVTVSYVVRHDYFDILEDDGVWGWIPEWVSEIIA